MADPRSSTRRRTVAAIVVAAVAAFVLLASIAQAVREDSWAPIWSIGWLPAVLVATFSAPVTRKRCRPRLPGGR